MSPDAADWLLRTDVDWIDIVRCGPPGFDVHLRVEFDDDEDTELAVLEVLRAHTTTPHDAYAAVWEGWIGGFDLPVAPRVPVPNREMLLFPAPVSQLRDVPARAWSLSPATLRVAPHLAWPADRAWCFACDVDEELTLGVGCSEAAAEALARALPGAVHRVAYGAAGPIDRYDA